MFNFNLFVFIALLLFVEYYAMCPVSIHHISIFVLSSFDLIDNPNMSGFYFNKFVEFEIHYLL